MKYKKLKNTLISLGIIISSPFISSVIMKIVPNVSVTANRLANTTIGESSKDIILSDKDTIPAPQIVQETTSDWSNDIISNGLGWNYSLNDTSDFNFFDEKFNKNAGEKPYPNLDTLTNHSGEVVQTIFNNYSGNQYVTLSSGALVKNVTSISNNILANESKNLPDFTIDLNSNEPQVLIMHTHTTESFEPFERTYYDNSFSYRTTDNSKNVVMIGDAITNELQNLGINTIHSTTVHDYPSYTGSYERSAVTVQNILNEYPSIKVVLDIHRDALSRDGNLLQPVVEIDGKKSAQIMIISGCDDGTMDMSNYIKNFRFASLLQNQIYSDYGDFARPILFDYRKYNQNLTTGSLLIEVGTHGSTLEQVRYAGQLLGKSIGKALVSISG
ncbi:MAG: stage II sporulation protein P [Oscillospiraceae bacterium]